MAKVMVDRNILIVIVSVTCLVCVSVSAGISTFMVNSVEKPNTGKKATPVHPEPQAQRENLAQLARLEPMEVME